MQTVHQDRPFQEPPECLKDLFVQEDQQDIRNIDLEGETTERFQSEFNDLRRLYTSASIPLYIKHI